MASLELGEEGGKGVYQTYLVNSSAPLTCFLFALPLFIVYHAGLWWLNTFEGLGWANAVDIAIADGLGRLGMAGPLLSFILVIIVFLAKHALSGKPWRWPPLYTWFLMIIESLLLALPVFMLSRLVMKLVDSIPLSMISAVSGDAGLSWQADLILSCGAGVYEEFFFRLLLMGILVFFLGRVLGIRGGLKYVVAAVAQALVFAASHHLPGGPEAVYSLADAKPLLPVFAFRVAAGIYFAFLYIERGFGVAAGAHAGYDLMVVLLDIFMPLETV
jgi:CAAX amino terminal protease family.